MIGNVISKRYARALFNLGNESGMEQMERYGKSLYALSELVETSKRLRELLASPIITSDEKKNVTLSLLKEVGGGDMEKRFCELLADRGRLSLLPAIAFDYKAMLDEAKGVSQGRVTTAIELEDERKSAIVSQLENQTGRKLELVFLVNPDILGGIILNVGDTVCDASLRAQLDNLRESIKRGE